MKPKSGHGDLQLIGNLGKASAAAKGHSQPGLGFRQAIDRAQDPGRHGRRVSLVTERDHDRMRRLRSQRSGKGVREGHHQDDDGGLSGTAQGQCPASAAPSGIGDQPAQTPGVIRPRRINGVPARPQNERVAGGGDPLGLRICIQAGSIRSRDDDPEFQQGQSILGGACGGSCTREPLAQAQARADMRQQSFHLDASLGVEGPRIPRPVDTQDADPPFIQRYRRAQNVEGADMQPRIVIPELLAREHLVGDEIAPQGGPH